MTPFLLCRQQANECFGFCWWSDEVKQQKLIHLTKFVQGLVACLSLQLAQQVADL